MDSIDWHTHEQAESIWAWLRPRLGEFGTVGGLVPSGFARYVSIPNSRDRDMNGCSLIQDRSIYHNARPDGADQLERLIAVLAEATAGDQPVHCAIWEGLGGMFRAADGLIEGQSWVTVIFSDERGPIPEAERLRVQQEARQQQREYAAHLPLRPPSTTLALRARNYYTWTSTLNALAADGAVLTGFSPSIVVPDDHSWLWHSDVDGRRTEVGGPAEILAPLVTAEWGGIDVDRAARLSSIPGWGA